MISNSQSGQDAWVDNVFKDKDPRELFFVDCAAHNGIDINNTYLLEKAGWKGICIEANRDIFKELIANRNSICYNVVCLDYNGTVGFAENGVNGKVIEGEDFQCFTLKTILGVQKVVDYLSLDVEGSELKVMQSIDFNECLVRSITVEHNKYANGSELKDSIFEFLSNNGFVRVEDDICVGNPNLPFEDWYLHKSMI